MKIFVEDRQTGKTRGIIKAMKLDIHAIMIIPYEIHKQHVPLSIRKRMYTMGQVMHGALNGLNYSHAYIDELGGCMDSIIKHISYGTHTN